jgi:hypothetical protein
VVRALAEARHASSSKNFTTIKEQWYSPQELLGIHNLLILRPKGCTILARKKGKGRVYLSAMCHRDDVWMSLRFQQSLVGAVAWGENNTEVDANISKSHTSGGSDGTKETGERCSGLVGSNRLQHQPCRSLRVEAKIEEAAGLSANCSVFRKKRQQTWVGAA